MMPLFQRSLLYPGGASPGVNWSHPAMAGVVRRKGFVGAAVNGGFQNLIDGTMGAVTGTPAASMKPGIGPGTLFTNSTDAISFGSNATTAATSITYAGKVWFNSLNAGSTTNSIIETNPNFNGAYLDSSGGHWVMQLNNTVVSSAIVPSINTPYFFIMSSLAATNVNFLFLNLLTGKIQTAVIATAASAAAAVAALVVGNSAGGGTTFPTLGVISRAAYIPKRLSMATMLAWASDPWALWQAPAGTIQPAWFSQPSSGPPPTFLPAWMMGSNLPVIGTGTY